MIFHQNFFYNSLINLYTNCFGRLINYRKRFDVNFFRWRHFDTISDLSFNSVLGSALAISSVSVKHKSQCLLPHKKGEDFAATLCWMVKSSWLIKIQKVYKGPIISKKGKKTYENQVCFCFCFHRDFPLSY